MWVVKLGGSLIGSPELANWLEIIANNGNGNVVIVPGGGMFADTVREAQKISNISNGAAHKLALLAMDQFGLLLAEMNPSLAIACSELEIAEYGWQHRGIVWLPSKMALSDHQIPASWQVTSDSLSAWLANKLNAEQLILVKSKLIIEYPSNVPVHPQFLVEDKLIDEEFINFSYGRDYGAWILNKVDYTIFKQSFNIKGLEDKGLLIDTKCHINVQRINSDDQ